MRILVIEDEKIIADNLKKGLEQESYAVDVCYDGVSGYDMAAGEPYDLIILDLMLPKMNGETICKKLRNIHHITTPILMLTAKIQLDDKIKGLDLGADDYMTKPFSFDELLARVRALLRRPKALNKPIIKLHDLTIDTNKKMVTRLGKDIVLSKTEYALLEYLAHHINHPISKQSLIEHVWDFDADILPNTVEVYIGYLRNKLEKPFPKLPRLIYTVRGFGYMLK